MIVVDASVAVKWVVEEPGRDQALSLVRSGEELIAPDIIVAEVLNVLRKKLKIGQLTREQARIAASDFAEPFARLVPVAGLRRAIHELTVSLDHSAYDCCYVACAMEAGAHLVTADDVLRGKAIKLALKISSPADWSRGAS